MQSRLTGAISLIIAQAIVLALGYVTHLLIGRWLGPGPYGIYGVVLSIQTIMGMFLTLGVPIAVSRFVAQDNNHAHSILRQALSIQATFALIIATVTALLAPVLAGWLGDNSLTNYIRFIAIIIFLQAFYAIYIQFLSGLHYFNRQAILTSVYALAKLIGALTLIFFFGVYGALAGFAIGGIIAGLIGWAWTRYLGGINHQQLPLKSFLSFAGTYVLILFSLQLLISLDLFMIKAILHNDVLAGYYNASVTLARIPYMLLQGLAFILLPSVSLLTKPGASHDQAATFIRDTLRYLIALIVPGVALAAATSRSLVTLFYSSTYLPAAPSLTVLIIGLGLLAFYLLLSNIVAGAGRANVSLLITVLMLVVSSIAGYLLIPRYGLMGAAWQTTIAGLVGLIIIAGYTFKKFRLPLPMRSAINILIATAVAVSLTYFWIVSPLLLILQYFVVFLIYIIVLVLLGEVTKDDRTRLAGLHPKLNWLLPPS